MLGGARPAPVFAPVQPNVSPDEKGKLTERWGRKAIGSTAEFLSHDSLLPNGASAVRSKAVQQEDPQRGLFDSPGGGLGYMKAGEAGERRSDYMIFTSR